MTQEFPSSECEDFHRSMEKISDLRKRFHSELVAGQRPQLEEFVKEVNPPWQSELRLQLQKIEREFSSTQESDKFETTYLKDFHLGSTELMRVEEAMADRPDPPRYIGRYRIEEELCQGGFGVVYRGRDLELNRRVAIKVPRRDRLEKDAERVELFRQEARTVAKLEHETIVPIYDVGNTDDVPLYIVSQFMTGGNVADLIAKGALPQNQAIDIAIRTVDALQHAHKNGFTHRDLKPQNILLDEAGRSYITDFGLAVHDLQEGENANDSAGTPLYMAPEQIVASSTSQSLDGRADIWAVGVLLYQMLSGYHPFSKPKKKRSELFHAIRHHDPKPLRQYNVNISPELEKLVQRCLEKEAANRFQSASELLHALKKIQKPKQRLNLKLVAVLAGLILAGAFIFIPRVSITIPPPPPPPDRLGIASKLIDSERGHEWVDLAMADDSFVITGDEIRFDLTAKASQAYRDGVTLLTSASDVASPLIMRMESSHTDQNKAAIEINHPKLTALPLDDETSHETLLAVVVLSTEPITDSDLDTLRLQAQSINPSLLMASRPSVREYYNGELQRISGKMMKGWSHEADEATRPTAGLGDFLRSLTASHPNWHSHAFVMTQYGLKSEVSQGRSRQATRELSP